MSQADLSKAANIDQGLISRIRRGITKPTPETLIAIARATKTPVEMVYRYAGLLPPDKKADKDLERILHELEGLTKEEQLEFLSYIRWRNNRSKK